MTHTLIRFEWPVNQLANRCQEFFLGYWQAEGEPKFAASVPAGIPHATRTGPTWFILSTLSELHDPACALVHPGTHDNGAVAFRGYVLEPPIHSYSAPDAIRDYWLNCGTRVHNGVFAAAVIEPSGGALTLTTDFLGLGPLYYRRVGEGVAFATSPRYLAAAGDEPDLVAWRGMHECGFISSDRSLNAAVSRVPAGKSIRVTREGIRVVPWFDFDAFPRGTRHVCAKAVDEVENAFRQAMRRCLRLQRDSVVVPFSSGHDSRRIVAELMRNGIPFETVTARVYQKQFRDLDARFAAEMARDFAFPNRIVNSDDIYQCVEDDIVRRALVDGESLHHTWAIPLVGAFPRQPSLILDGILGDILGNPGFRMPGMYGSPRNDIELIAQACVPGALDVTLNAKIWPSADDLRADIRAYLKPFSERGNVAELAFILLRERRAISLWSQQLFPPGYVTACPYAELDYVRLMLEFVPADKHQTVFQRACLRKFFPKFAQYPGNRDIPPDLSPGSPLREHEQTYACMERLRQEIRSGVGENMLRGLLRARGKLALNLSRGGRRLAMRTSWILLPLMELVSRHVQRTPCWHVTH